ncbi:MAG TPA: DUF1345 domain-containing protein [Solirubrobacteraceae bacterium]|nr:DUF1345 domain-containing protein [Solirubrobacteraceae bacterium]
MSATVDAGSAPGAGVSPSSRRRLGASTGAGVLGGVVVAVLGPWWLIPLVAWILAALVYVVWMWSTIWPLGPEETARQARAEDLGRASTDIVLLSASLVSLVALGLVLVRAGQMKGLDKGLLVGTCVLSVVLAWTVVHTVFTLRYADLYYGTEPGGIDFNEDDPPCYSDFAYFAWTIGMTFQVSDTDIKRKAIRRTALRHAILSYVFGALIIATTVNLVAGLGK